MLKEYTRLGDELSIAAEVAQELRHLPSGTDS
jgi:hypothetical protein